MQPTTCPPQWGVGSPHPGGGSVTMQNATPLVAQRTPQYLPSVDEGGANGMGPGGMDNATLLDTLPQYGSLDHGGRTRARAGLPQYGSRHPGGPDNSASFKGVRAGPTTIGGYGQYHGAACSRDGPTAVASHPGGSDDITPPPRAWDGPITIGVSGQYHGHQRDGPAGFASHPGGSGIISPPSCQGFAGHNQGVRTISHCSWRS